MEILKAASGGLNVQIRHIVTRGDRIQHVALSKAGGKGLFVKEIERALLDGSIDLAVHSMKDMPADLPEGLEIGGIPAREDPGDVLISRNGGDLDTLAPGAIIGTSSLRRAAQILYKRPDLKIKTLRGNVDTRLSKLKSGAFDAIVLARAGLNRLERKEQAISIPFAVMLPAVGQGALAIECRSGDAELKALLKKISDEKTWRTVLAERAFLKKLEGGCQVPIAAHCVLRDDGCFSLDGLVASPDGQTLLRTERDGRNPEKLGYLVAESLLNRGADKILAAFRPSEPGRE